MRQKNNRYYGYKIKTSSGKIRTGIYRANSHRTATSGVTRRFKNAKNIRVYKTHPTKLKHFK